MIDDKYTSLQETPRFWPIRISWDVTPSVFFWLNGGAEWWSWVFLGSSCFGKDSILGGYAQNSQPTTWSCKKINLIPLASIGIHAEHFIIERRSERKIWVFKKGIKVMGSRVKSVSKYWLHIVLIVSEERGWHFRRAAWATKVLGVRPYHAKIRVDGSVIRQATPFGPKKKLLLWWWDRLISNLNCFSHNPPGFLYHHATNMQNFDGSDFL